MLRFEISISLDGYVAGPNQSEEHPLGEGGMQLHEWILKLAAWREPHGRLPSSYDWSRTHAQRRGGEPLERVADGQWPAASVVTDLFGSWAAARTAAVWREVAP